MRCLIVRSVFLGLCSLAALTPLKEKPIASATAGFPGWPAEWDGDPIDQVPLSERDQEFSRGFPGRIARFTDGRRELIFRWVTTASRQLHSSADCFRGLGYEITPKPAVRDTKGQCWSCISATQREHRFLVRERITDEKGNAWTDVSAWYWSTLLRQTEGPWLSVTIVESSG